MNDYTREKLGAFIQILKSLGVDKEQIFGICDFLETEEMMQEMLDRLEEKDFQVLPQEATNICCRVIAEHWKQ